MDRCVQHGKELEVHCDDHQELCCSVCVALNHRLCSSIIHLPDLARGFLKTTEFKQLPAAVDKMRSRLDELKNDCMKDQASLKDSYKNIIAEIKALRKEINQILDELEKKTVKQLDNMMDDLEKSIKDDLETCVHMDDQLKTMIEKLQQITGKNKETNSYIGFRVCQSKLSEANSLVQEIRQKEGMKFKSDESVLPFLRNLNSLGTVENPNSISVYKAQSSSLYKVRIKEDKYKCHIAGICELYVGGKNDLYLYTTDGRLVKKIYEDKSKYITVCRCAVSPDGERIYVTNPTAFKLITLDTSGQVLSTVEDPDLKQPTGLCVSPGGHVFVCGCISNTVVQVDPQGRRKLATLARETDGMCLPQSVWFIEKTSTLIVGQEDEDNITVLKLC
ncbi:uncharacterized protein LOC128218402 [Mya arenaria]|uniref:uncharacterized protein LOC128218402 n=1 Tax=Mya arenaria TaxID=6604 RepID=UPI0022E7F730|nr:uncharacterized protein LOC128218402 [Mya arenaria]